MVKDGALPFRFAKEHGSRVGLLPKGAKSGAEIRWFEVRLCVTVLTVRVVLFVC